MAQHSDTSPTAPRGGEPEGDKTDAKPGRAQAPAAPEGGGGTGDGFGPAGALPPEAPIDKGPSPVG